MAANGQGRSGFLAAGLGGVLGGALVYLVTAGMGGGLDLEDRLTFDQSGELELEGLGILAGLVLASIVGVALGSYLALKVTGASMVAVTALVAVVVTPVVTLVNFRLAPAAPRDPVIAPYLVLAGWFGAVLLARVIAMRVGRSLK